VQVRGAQVTGVAEADGRLWNWMPAEVVLESRAYSPLSLSQWGIDEPLSELGQSGAAAPLRRYDAAGSTKEIDQLVFDGFVFPQEDELRLELSAKEIDLDARYGVAETIQPPYADDLGGGSLLVSVRAPGSYPFRAASWNGVVEVQVVDYPFDLSSDTVAAGSLAAPALRLDPNPFSRSVRITVSDARGLAAAAGSESATLAIYDVSGRLVRRVPGSLQTGFAWDGRDGNARPLPAGVYLQRLTAGPHTLLAKALLVR